MGSQDQMILLGMMITVIFLGLACVVLFYFIPSRLASNQQRSIKNFMNFFTFTASAFIIFLFMGKLVTTDWSVVINSVLYIAAIHYLKQGLTVRYNPKSSSLYKKPEFIGNIVFVAISQIIFLKYFKDPALVGNLVLNGNIILLCLLCLPLVKQNLNGERVVRYSIYFSVLLIFSLTVSQYHPSLRPYYMFFVMSIQATLFIVWLGALFGLLLSDNIEQHFKNSMTDALTGLNNRRYFMHRATELINDTKEKLIHTQPLKDKYIERTQSENNLHNAHIIICDIDHFKKINDTHGHNVGDKVICHVSNLLRQVTCEGDVLSRIGGEEFALFLPNASSSDVLAIAKHLQQLTYKNPYQQIHFTISTGIAFAKIASDTKADELLEKLLIDADRALYQSKDEGRDSISVVQHGGNIVTA